MAMDLTVVCRDFLQLMSMTPLQEAGAKSSFQSTYSQKEYAENMRPISVSNKKKVQETMVGSYGKGDFSLASCEWCIGLVKHSNQTRFVSPNITQSVMFPKPNCL